MPELIKAGGWLIVPILVCSLVAAIIIFERLLALRRAGTGAARAIDDDSPALDGTWCDRPAGNANAAAGFAAGPDRGGGFGQSRPSPRSAAERIEDTGRHVVHELERFLNTLGTIAAISPLLGLLGTVAGMIKIFQVVSVQGNSNFSLLSIGIAEALVTTAAGLTVAIPSLLFYRYFQGRVDELVVRMEQETLQLIDLLDSGTEAREQQP